MAQEDPWLIDVGAMTFMEEGRNTGLELIIQGSEQLMMLLVFNSNKIYIRP